MSGGVWQRIYLGLGADPLVRKNDLYLKKEETTQSFPLFLGKGLMEKYILYINKLYIYFF